MREIVVTSSGLKISISHESSAKDRAIVIAPGFFQSKETMTFQKIAKDLSLDFDVVSMDFRGHGKSEGLYTFSALEKEDLKSVIDYAKQSYKKVGVLGFSLGGSVAIIEQAEFRNIDSLVCVCSPMASKEVEFKWWTLAAMRLGLRGLERGAGVRPGNPWLPKVNAIDVVSQISPTPIFFIHGAKDPTVNVRHSQMMFDKASEPKALKIFEKASHAEDIYRDFPAEFIQVVNEWFSKTL